MTATPKTWCPFHAKMTGPTHVCWRLYSTADVDAASDVLLDAANDMSAMLPANGLGEVVAGWLRARATS